MNRAFDYNGTIVATSRPVKALRTLKKTLVIDSADRDTSKYYTNGDFVIYLPRVYENITSIRLAAAEFPGLTGAVLHQYSSGQNLPSNLSGFAGDTGPSPIPYYFMVELDGLNKTDETMVSGNKSTFTDSFFAKIPAIVNGTFIEYNDKSAQDNIARYNPPIGKLDRLRIRTRVHNQQGTLGFMYWTSNGQYIGSSSNRIVDFSLTLEFEYMDNGFEEYSTLETRIANTLESKIRS
jgi:hypothetical protein